VIEILILYILTKYDATIYKLKKLIGEKFFVCSTPSLGAINPALKKLESLSCVEFSTNMSEGGLLSKTYKITAFGQKYLKSALTSFEFKNKAHTLNNVSIIMCASDILEEEEKKQVFRRCSGELLILKKDINDALLNPYNMYTDIQKAVIEANLGLVEKMISELEI